MKRLILVRHATAVDKGPEGSDFHRRLKKRGRREARLMAERYLGMLPLPDQLFTSPADRALQTAGAFAEMLGLPDERVTLREELYGGLDPEEFLRIVQRFDDQLDSVMVFGHDPSFTEFAAFMIPGFKESIPKAGILVIDIDRPRWKAVRAGDGQAVLFERPPAPDVLKRMEEDVIERLVAAIRQGILGAASSLELVDSPEVTRLVARTAKKLARDLRPFVRAASTETAPSSAKKKHARARGTGGGKARKRSAS